ncbi:MAG: type II toxin-antitoxin system PemK/MazF family toxin [Planctomycetota bacterium]
MIRQGDVRWAELPDPTGSGPGFRRPVVVVQGDAFNQSRIPTTVCVTITSNLSLAAAPGNVPLAPDESGLDRDSVANVSQVVTLDRSDVSEREGVMPADLLERILSGIELVLGRE